MGAWPSVAARYADALGLRHCVDAGRLSRRMRSLMRILQASGPYYVQRRVVACGRGVCASS